MEQNQDADSFCGTLSFSRIAIKANTGRGKAFGNPNLIIHTESDARPLLSVTRNHIMNLGAAGEIETRRYLIFKVS